MHEPYSTIQQRVDVFQLAMVVLYSQIKLYQYREVNIAPSTVPMICLQVAAFLGPHVEVVECVHLTASL